MHNGGIMLFRGCPGIPFILPENHHLWTTAETTAAGGKRQKHEVVCCGDRQTALKWAHLSEIAMRHSVKRMVAMMPASVKYLNGVNLMKLTKSQSDSFMRNCIGEGMPQIDWASLKDDAAYMAELFTCARGAGATPVSPAAAAKCFSFYNRQCTVVHKELDLLGTRHYN